MHLVYLLCPSSKLFCTVHTDLTCVCRPQQSALDQVVLPLGSGSSAVLSRITDTSGTWLGLRQVHDKLIKDKLPFQTYKNHLKRHAVTTRAASFREIGYLATNGAIKKRTKNVSCLEVESLAVLIENSLRDQVLAQKLVHIPELEAVEEGDTGHLRLGSEEGKSIYTSSHKSRFF